MLLRQGHRLAAILGHPLPLIRPAVVADTARAVRGIGAVLEVVPMARGQGGLKRCRPVVVGLGDAPDLVGCQAKVT